MRDWIDRRQVDQNRFSSPPKENAWVSMRLSLTRSRLSQPGQDQTVNPIGLSPGVGARSASSHSGFSYSDSAASMPRQTRAVVVARRRGCVARSARAATDRRQSQGGCRVHLQIPRRRHYSRGSSAQPFCEVGSGSPPQTGSQLTPLRRFAMIRSCHRARLTVWLDPRRVSSHGRTRTRRCRSIDIGG